MVRRFKVDTVTPLADVGLVVGVEEMKKHLGVDHAEDDGLIAVFLAAAQEAVEKFTGQVLTPRVLRWSAERFPCLPEPVRLYRSPVTAIVAVRYADSGGVMQSLDAADWRWSEAAGDTLLPALAGDWPAFVPGAGAAAVQVDFEAGYEDGLAPPALSQAVKLTAASYYLDREGGGGGGELPPAAQFLCRPYRSVMI